jgi:hypothetical protein
VPSTSPSTGVSQLDESVAIVDRLVLAKCQRTAAVHLTGVQAIVDGNMGLIRKGLIVIGPVPSQRSTDCCY